MEVVKKMHPFFCESMNQVPEKHPFLHENQDKHV